MPGIASSAPAVMIAHVAAATSTIRVGSGGVMLPNHSPLVVAEQFGTLEALHPGRIDLGIGRAPGTDPLTAQALRRAPLHHGRRLPRSSSVSCIGYFDGSFADDHPYRNIRAVPGLGYRPAIWLLGSSDYSAQLAGLLGLPFSFAHHFASANTEPALEIYRAQLPAVGGARRAVRDARRVRRVRAHRRRGAAGSSAPSALAIVRLRSRAARAVPDAGGSGRVHVHAGRAGDRAGLDVIARRRHARHGAGRAARARGAHRCDELMLTTVVHGHAERRRSYALVADAMQLTPLHASLLTSRQGATCIMSVNPDGSCLPMLPCSKMPHPV